MAYPPLRWRALPATAPCLVTFVFGDVTRFVDGSVNACAILTSGTVKIPAAGCSPLGQLGVQLNILATDRGCTAPGCTVPG